MTKPINEQALTASDALADAMLAAVDAGVPDEIVCNEVVKLALTLIQAAQGGRRDLVPVVLRKIADAIEANPEGPITIN